MVDTAGGSSLGRVFLGGLWAVHVDVEFRSRYIFLSAFMIQQGVYHRRQASGKGNYKEISRFIPTNAFTFNTVSGFERALQRHGPGLGLGLHRGVHLLLETTRLLSAVLVPMGESMNAWFLLFYLPIYFL